MHKLFGSSSQEIQLSSDDEDDYGRSLSSGFGGCMPCLPKFNISGGGGGTIKLSAEDATLDDYLDPNTTTTIEPLLDEYINHDRNDAFGGAVLQNSQRFLTRNPFASTTPTPTPIPTEPTGSSKSITTFDNNSGDSHQEQPHHSFSVAAPRVDFFMENNADDDSDAEFLSDHRISAVIGDTKKLASQFELFETEMDSGKHLQDDSISLALNHTSNEQEGNKTVSDQAQPFELESNWSDNMDLDSADPDQQPQLYRTNSVENNQHLQEGLNGASGTTTDLKRVEELPEKTVDSNIDVDDSSDQTTCADEVAETTNTHNSRDINSHMDTKLDQDDLNQVESTELAANSVPSMHAHDSEFSTQNHYDHNDTALTALSEPSSPIPTVSDNSVENSPNKFPLMGLPRTSALTPASPMQHTPANTSTDSQQPLKNMKDLTSNNGGIESQNLLPSTSAIPSDITNADGTAMATDSNITGRRRSSVAAVAHSILGDKLDDFTEKLTYIRKNIISSLDDSDDNDDQNIPRPSQQPWRPRSSSMLQHSQRQSSERLYSPTSEKSQDQQLSTDDPRANHRRSNSMMDSSPSFAKFFQQMGGGESNHRQVRSSSPIIPPQRSSSASSSSSPQPRQQYQHPKRSRSTSALASPQTSRLSHGASSSSSSLQGVDEQQEMDEDDLFEFSKVIAMGKNVRNISEDLMANGMRLFNDFSTKMKNANADRMGQGPSSNTAQQHHHRHQQQQQSTNDGFLLSETYI
ncbi:unnamed protein product [Absidia cylindrospora]